MTSVLSLSLLWLRVALGCYLAGLAAALGGAFGPQGRRESWFGLARAAVAAGFLFQLVSLVETAAAFQAGPVNFYREITSLLAFVITAFFLMVYRIYSPRALSLVVVPLLCLLTAAAALAPTGAPGPPAAARSLLDNPWIVVHIFMIFCGYAGLVLAVASGLLYLAAERALKAKGPIGPAPSLLPSLATLDTVGYRSLLVGFPLLSAGLVIGLYWANAVFGHVALGDPTILLALLAWVTYLVLLFARWSAGWRGRRSAYLSLVCLGLALAGWLANGFSHLHGLFLQ